MSRRSYLSFEWAPREEAVGGSRDMLTMTAVLVVMGVLILMLTWMVCKLARDVSSVKERLAQLDQFEDLIASRWRHPSPVHLKQPSEWPADATGLKVAEEEIPSVKVCAAVEAVKEEPGSGGGGAGGDTFVESSRLVG